MKEHRNVLETPTAHQSPAPGDPSLWEEDVIDLRVYFDVVKRWLWLIILCGVLAAAAAYGASRLATPIYQAKATLLIEQARTPADVQYNDILASQRIAATYAQLMTRRPVLERVADLLNVDPAAVDPDDNDAQGVTDINVSAVRDTQLVEVTVEGISPRLVTAVANALPQVFIQELESLQRSRFADSKANLERQLNFLQQQIQETQIALAKLDQGEDNPAERARLETALAQYQASYTNLLQSYEDLRLAELQSIDTVSLWEEATLPEGPVRPRVLLNTLLALIVGMMLAIGAVFVVEYLDDRFRSPDEMTRILGLPWLAAIGQIPGVDRSHRHTSLSLIAAHQPRHPITEAYRRLRTNLQFANVDEGVRSLVVTSVGPGEGKSTTAANLALVMAQAGIRVALVDADMRRPVQHRIFDLTKSPGLTDALVAGEAGPWPFIREVMPNLYVLPVGKIPPNPAELLGSRRMHELLHTLHQRVDVVICDAPPVLAVTDSAVLGRITDGVLLVLDVNVTTRSTAQDAVNELRQLGVHLLGIVVNQVSTRTRGYGWYEQRYYRYRYEEHDSEAEEAPISLPTTVAHADNGASGIGQRVAVPKR
ncbi:MAG: polysaccharide biosynthesis tyrosine autokinase [Caldilineae bacterium]|nr:MAG: polysaccharide biosynthesis tyrosine autokinase [Caldilineae bacterium]